MDKFIDYWRSLSADEKRAMAERLLTSVAYLSQLAHGHRNPGRHFKNALERDMEETIGKRKSA